jgi:hypothetical protein
VICGDRAAPRCGTGHLLKCRRREINTNRLIQKIAPSPIHIHASSLFRLYPFNSRAAARSVGKKIERRNKKNDPRRPGQALTCQLRLPIPFCFQTLRYRSDCPRACASGDQLITRSRHSRRQIAVLFTKGNDLNERFVAQPRHSLRKAQVAHVPPGRWPSPACSACGGGKLREPTSADPPPWRRRPCRKPLPAGRRAGRR